MLQRSSTNSHSWLYASHIRTKQSKWLDQSLQDMEEKVQNMLRMIEHDGDSFAKRAEMYYKKRPELINSVEESYRAFRALAERFDNLSNQLHTANHTIATVCPEQIQKMAMEDDYDFDSPRFPKNHHLPLPANEPISPKPSKASKRDLKLKPIITTPSKPFQFKNKLPNVEDSVVVSTPPSAKSGLTKQEAIEEIERLQKEICGLQTVKELVRSETGFSKFQEIDKQIMELQQSVSRLQDEFGVGIDDKAARDLVAEAALKSCQEILAKLQEEQEKCAKQAKDESQKIADADQKQKSIKSEYLNEGDESQGSNQEPGDAKKAETALKSCQESLAKLQEEQEKCAKEAKDESQKIADADRKLKSIKSEYLNDEEYQEDESQGSNQEPGDSKEGLLQQTFKEEEQIDDGNSKGNLTVTDLTIKIDELVEKVVTLEITLTSQTALIDTLRTESNDLHAQIQSLEDDKASLTEDKHNLSNTVNKLEEELKKLKNLNEEVQNENSRLQSQLAEAISSADNLSENLKTAKPDNKIESMEPKEEDMENKTGEQKGEGTKPEAKHVTFAEPRILESPTKQQNKANEEEKNSPPIAELEKDEKFNWQKMLLNGVEDKERVLLKEYTTILRSYKDIKKQVEEMEKKDRDNQFEVALQISDLKTTISKKDEEIQTLHQKLNLLPGLTEEEKLAMLNNSSSSNQKHVSDTISIDKPASISPVEENLRQKIDAVLDENLDFWLRFSTSYHQVPKFKTAVKDLQDEVIQATQSKAKKTHKKFKTEIKPAYKQLIETHNELSSWLEQSQFLKDELERRTWSLYRIQEDITQALRDGVEEDEIRFSSHQAAKFHGEILNMKQEHVKVREELQAGVDHIASLQAEVEKVVKHLDQEYGFLMVDHPILLTSKTKTRVPLRTFIFGSNRKKQRRSVFSCIPSGKYEVLRDGSHP